MKLFLASSSPRRREILEQIKAHFYIIEPSDDAEMPLPDHKDGGVAEIAEQNAALKARWAAGYSSSDGVILAADTIVVLGSDIMGKPSDDADAMRMLSMLSGRTHQVITGVAALNNGDGSFFSSFETTDVSFKELSEEEIKNYVLSGEPADKAGGYAIQGIGSRFIKSIHGCYFNVVGLPVYKSIEVVKRVYPQADRFFGF